jgi:glycosyltransferase involved in cell wall biosynthesis
MVPPRISVIVPVHNQDAFLGAALDSIGEQNMDGVEVIVVDDGSQQPITDLVRKHCPSATLLRQENAGPSAARNLGIRIATGEFLAFLDADDKWTPNALATLTQGFRDAPSAGVVQGHVRHFRERAPVGPREPAQEAIYLGFNLGAIMVRRDVLVDTGLFDERLRHSEDVDLFMRLHDRGVKKLVLPQLVLEYRRHSRSLTGGHTKRDGAQIAAKTWITILHSRRERRMDPLLQQSEPDTAAKAPAVSVVIAVRNGRTHLPACLESIRLQTYPPSEIIAVVGPSDDDTLSYLDAQPDVRTVAQRGIGLADARNQGVGEAQAGLIAFHDHDDLWDPRKLALQWRVLALFDSPAAVITRMRLLDDEDVGLRTVDPNDRSNAARLGWTPSALLVHRAVLDEVGPFDPSLGLGCDTDWFRRLRQSNHPLGVAPHILLRKRLHQTNLSREPRRNRDAMFKMLRKHRAASRE